MRNRAAEKVAECSQQEDQSEQNQREVDQGLDHVDKRMIAVEGF
jgi:hypothetical protein